MNINKYEEFYPSILMHERQCGLSSAYIVYEKEQLEILEQEVLKAIIIKALIIEEVIKYIKCILYKIELIKYNNNNNNDNIILTSYDNTNIRKNQIKNVYCPKLLNKNNNIIYDNNLIKDIDRNNFKNKLYIIQFNGNESVRRNFFKTEQKNTISNDNIRIQGNDVIENKNEKINKSLCNIISNENKEIVLNKKNLDTLMLLEKIKTKTISFINKSSYVVIYKSINDYNNVLQKELIDISSKCCNNKFQLYSKNINSYSIIDYVTGHINKMKEYQMRNKFLDDIIVKIKDELYINIDLIYKNKNNKSFLSVMENINYTIVNTYNINQDKLESFKYLHFNFFYICSKLENKSISNINKYNKVNNNICNIFLYFFVMIFFHLYIQNSDDKRKEDICNNFYNILKYNSYNYEKFYVFILLCIKCIVSIRNDKLINFVPHNGRKKFSNDDNKELYNDNSTEKKMTIRTGYHFKFNINKKSIHNRNYYFINYAHHVIFNTLYYCIVKGCNIYYKIKKSKEFKRNTYYNNNNYQWTNYFNYIQLYNKCKKINNKYRKMKIIGEIILSKNLKYENNKKNKTGSDRLSGTYFLYNNNKKRNYFIVYYKRYIKRGYANSGNNKQKMFCFKNDNIVLLNKIILYLIDKNRKDAIKKDKLNIKEWHRNTKLYCNSNNAEGGDGGYNNHSNSNYRNNGNNNIGNYNNNGSNFFGNNMGGNNNDNDDNDNNDENNYKPKNTCNDDDNDNDGGNKK